MSLKILNPERFIQLTLASGSECIGAQLKRDDMERDLGELSFGFWHRLWKGAWTSYSVSFTGKAPSTN